MSIIESTKAFKIELPEAKSFQMQGTLWRVLATGDETGGIVGALDERCAHGIAAPMHTHEREDEIFYVIDGSITFFAGEKSIDARAGTFVFLPRFIEHGFRVDSTEARVFNFVTPSGFEKLIVDMGKPASYDELAIPVSHPSGDGPQPPDLLERMRTQYGMRIGTGPTPPQAKRTWTPEA